MCTYVVWEHIAQFRHGLVESNSACVHVSENKTKASPPTIVPVFALRLDSSPQWLKLKINMGHGWTHFGLYQLDAAGRML